MQRVFGILVFNGVVRIKGVRTAKRFFLKKPKLLLRDWLEQYSILKQCKLWTYQSSLQGKEGILQAVVSQSAFKQHVSLALHSAAEAYGCKNTNLQTVELYLSNPSIRSKIVKILHLRPQERGYEVLLIEPYYKCLLARESILDMKIKVAPSLLTYLDLYHFPLRGQEQAEFMLQHIPELTRIFDQGN